MTGADWQRMSRDQRRWYSARTLWSLALETAVMGLQYEEQRLPQAMMADALGQAGFYR